MSAGLKRATVGVVIPLYNSATTIKATLDSLLAQTLQEWSAMVVNDGSTDAGPHIVEQRAARDPRIVMVNQSNQGLAEARNRGLEAFDQPGHRPEFVYFLDADDVLMPRGLELLVTEARFTGSLAVYGRIELLTEDGKSTGWSPLIDHFSVGHQELLKGCVFPVHAQLIRHDALDGQRFGQGLRIAEDWDFWIRLSERGVHWTGFDGLIGGYRMRPAGLSRDATGMFAGLVETVIAAHARCGADGRAVVDELAIEWATAAAARGGTRASPAGLQLLRSAVVQRIDPRMAAVKAFHRLPTARCLSPHAWHEEPAPLAELTDSWWRSLVRAGLVDRGFVAIAKEKLAQLLAHPRAVGEHISSQLDPARPVALLGMGRNARHVAMAVTAFERHPFNSKLRLWGFDDLQTSPPRWTQHLATPVTMVSRLADLPPDAQLVLTPSHDEPLFNRLSAASAALRWSIAASEVARRNAQLLNQVWPVSTPTLGSVPIRLAPRAKVA